MVSLPGVNTITKRPLQIIMIIDCSRSMADSGRLEVINRAFTQGADGVKRFRRDNPHVQVTLSAVTFADKATWHVYMTPVEELIWPEIGYRGEGKCAGEALALVADQVKVEKMPERGLRPVIVFVTDGRATDDFEKGLEQLNGQIWGKKSIRNAILIGDFENSEEAGKFSSPTIPVLIPENRPDMLEEAVRYFSLLGQGEYNSWLKKNQYLEIPVPKYGPPPDLREEGQIEEKKRVDIVLPDFPDEREIW